MHTSQDAKDKEINILQKVSQFNHNAYRHLEDMLCVVMYNYMTSNPIACTNFRTCLAVTTTIAIFLHLQGLLFWGGQTRVQLYSHGNSQASTCTPFWFITGSLMLPCPVQCWDFGAAKSLYCPGLHEQVAYPLAYNYKMVYGLLFINLIIALPM
jgi:hypothetical protein